MRPVRVTLTAAGVSAPVILDHYRAPFSVGIAVTKPTLDAVAYSVEVTYDDVFSSTFNPSTASWLELPGFPAGTNTVKDGSLSSPVTAVRLKAATITAPNSLTITVIQAGMPGA
jgi:hypothetical protein